MGDAGPNYRVEAQRLRHQIAQLRMNIERDRLAILEADDRQETARENIEASEKAIAELEGRLKDIPALTEN